MPKGFFGHGAGAFPIASEARLLSRNFCGFAREEELPKLVCVLHEVPFRLVESFVLGNSEALGGEGMDRRGKMCKQNRDVEALFATWSRTKRPA
jgi:hypothetical protein